MGNNYKSNLNNFNGDFNHTTGFTPVGTVISYFGETAPENYLVCDGTAYNKTDYPELWTLLSSLTDTTPYVVSGDNTKFKVPDLRGEFLRGTGTNSHTNQGSGAGVGEHQDATINTKVCVGTNSIYTTKDIDLKGLQDNKSDKIIVTTTGYIQYTSGTTQSSGGGTWAGGTYTSRPTNTSVLYCIAYKNIYIDAVIGGENTVITNPQEGQGLVYDATNGVWKNGAGGMHEYSTTEKVVGTWIDGRPVYEKTLFNTNEIVFTSKDRRWIDIATVVDVDKVISMKGNVGLTLTSNPNVVYMYKDIPYADNLYSYEISLAYDIGNSKLKLLERGIIDEKIKVGNLMVIFRYIKTTDTPTQT